MSEKIRARAGVTPSHVDGKPVARVVDPSDAVMGLGFAFGAVGALLGVVAALVVSPGISFALLGYCILAALAGGSAGVVIGGMVGAVFAVMRGVTSQSDAPKRDAT
ncbi:hypothetical protein [Rhizobium sp. LjRoot254]|uniref:hypothetical protein n=1 Tax=Rhizobium sp. LjRoot254 TaxID=3342297 RepID=UPI003ED07B32